MPVRHRPALLGAVAAGLLVVAALPAVAQPTPTTPGETAVCTAARAAQDAYRTEVITAEAEQLADRVEEVEDQVVAQEALVETAEEAFTSAQAALAAADVAVSEAEEALVTAQAGGDPDEVAAAEEVLAETRAAREAAAGGADAAEETLDDVSSGLLSLQVELVEVEAAAEYLTSLSYGRDFATEEQLERHVAEMRVVGLPQLVEYADLVEELAEACFVFPGDEDDDGAGDDSDDVPGAPVAEPLPARADYTG